MEEIDSRSRLLVIIVTYNGMKWLDRCLSSVVNASIPADLFIVDNGSTDGSIDFIKSNYPKSKFIESKENSGFGKANNLGLRYALDNGYDYVYLLNQDAWVDSNTFETLINVQKCNPEYGIISPLQINASRTKLDRIFAEYLPEKLASDSLLKIPLKNVYQTNFVMAAHWLVSINCIKQVGGFSPSFPHYGEDDNLIHRTIFHGLKVGICPKVSAVHDREFRKETDTHKKYMKYIYFLKIFNNPLLSDRKRQSIRYIISSSIRKDGLRFSDILNILKSLQYMQRNFMLSLKKGDTFI